MKKSWNTDKGKKRFQHQIVESYRDPETGKPRHRSILNISCLPDYAIEAVKQSLRKGSSTAIDIDDVQMKCGDSLCGAGFIVAYWYWREEGMEKVLEVLTEVQKITAMAMILQKMFTLGRKSNLQEDFENSIITQHFSQKRLDSKELYQVIDVLNDNFYDIQARLTSSRDVDSVLFFYHMTSTFFEGTEASDGDDDYSQDEEYDSYQIDIVLICDEQGLPFAIEVWPEDITDKTTLTQNIMALKKRLGIKKAIFVRDGEIDSNINIEDLEEEGFDDILHVGWHTQHEQFETLGSPQRTMFSQRGVFEWFEEEERSIGCSSGSKKHGGTQRLERKMKIAEEELTQLAEIVAKENEYSLTGLRERIRMILKKNGVAGLWKTNIEYINQDSGNLEEKAPLELSFEIDREAMYRHKLPEGKYIVRTSLEDEMTLEEIELFYGSLQKAKRAFRYMTSYLKTGSFYHRRGKRVRGHVLVSFLAYYLRKSIELELQKKEITTEVELLLNDWNKLHIVKHQISVGEYSYEEWNWSLGEIGSRIKDEISSIGWWHAIDSYKCSLLR